MVRKGELIYKPSSLKETRKNKNILKGARMGKIYIRKVSKNSYGLFER